MYSACCWISVPSKLSVFEHIRFTEELDLDDEAKELPPALMNLSNLSCMNCSKSCNGMTFSLREFEGEGEGGHSAFPSSAGLTH